MRKLRKADSLVYAGMVFAGAALLNLNTLLGWSVIMVGLFGLLFTLHEA